MTSQDESRDWAWAGKGTALTNPHSQLAMVAAYASRRNMRQFLEDEDGRFFSSILTRRIVVFD